jgi:hypothetical protein
VSHICPTCTYPSRREDGCDNPACIDNVTHSPEWRATLISRYAAETARREAEEMERAKRKHIREWARRNGATAAF